MTLSITLPGAPIFESHQQKKIVQFKKGGKLVKSIAQSTKYTSAKKRLTQILAQYAPDKPIAGPVEIELTAYWPLRSGTKKADREKVERKDTKPDGDNVMKLYADCLESAGFFTNDSQASDEITRKRWSEDPRVEIVITQLDQFV